MGNEIVSGFVADNLLIPIAWNIENNILNFGLYPCSLINQTQHSANVFCGHTFDAQCVCTLKVVRSMSTERKC